MNSPWGYHRSRNWSSEEYVHFTFGILGILIFAFVVYAVFFGSKEVIRTDRSGCLVNHALNGHTLLLVDNTDPFSPAQIKEFRKEADGIHKNVDPWAMFTVASIRGEVPGKIELSICSPEQGKPFGVVESIRRSEVNPLVLKRQYEQKYDRRINDLISRMPLNDTTRYSPIIETLVDVTETLGPRWEGVAKRNLIIFSGLMENTKEFSQYEPVNSKRSFAEVRRAVQYVKDSVIDLHDTEVTVFYLTGRLKDRGLQGRYHEKFWRELIAFYGGHVAEWIPTDVKEPY